MPDTNDNIDLEVPETNLLSAKEVASMLGISPKDFRRWLRTKVDERAGRGGRWAFSTETADQLVALYEDDHAPKSVELELDEVEADENDFEEID